MASKPAPAGHNEAPRPIIVKKVTVVAASHHGGAWKVAYADFVTAMMAFFLLMWLLGATTEQQRRGLADYFTPTLVKNPQDGGGSNGFFGGSSLTDVDEYPHRAGQTGTETLTVPRDATGGPKEGSGVMKRMQERLETKLAERKELRKLLNQVRMVQTSEGIRIDLVDDADFSMFALGTTVLTPDAQALIAALAASVMPEAGALTIRGHTDALPWRSGMRGNNWALSTGRAEATRQALLLNGIGEGRFKRIEGVADREPLIKGDPSDPRNRRISILIGR